MDENEEKNIKSRFKEHIRKNSVISSLFTICLYLSVINYLGTLVIGDILAITLENNGSTLEEFRSVVTSLGTDITAFPLVMQQSYYTAVSYAELLIYIIILIIVLIFLLPLIKNDFRTFFTFKPEVKAKLRKPNGYFDPETNTYFSYLEETEEIEPKSNEKQDSKKFQKIFVYLLIGYALNIIGGLISTGIKYIEGGGDISEVTTRNQESINQLMTSGTTNLIIMCIITIFIAPFVEELIFRKSIFNLLQTKYLSIIVSSIAFGLAHTLSSGYTNPVLFFANTVPYLILGFYLAYIYELENRNIVSNIFVHMGINAISVFFLLISL